jgi:hypothetical protein
LFLTNFVSKYNIELIGFLGQPEEILDELRRPVSRIVKYKISLLNLIVIKKDLENNSFIHLEAFRRLDWQALQYPLALGWAVADSS